jgi:16S rRNA (uracil1498-N3)-methyltransferase
VLVGPEGGWSEAELQLAAGDGRVVGLGTTVLRAETAAVAAGVLLTARRAGLIPIPD